MGAGRVANSELVKGLLADGGGAILGRQEHHDWLYRVTFFPLIDSYPSETHSLDFDEQVFNDLHKRPPKL